MLAQPMIPALEDSNFSKFFLGNRVNAFEFEASLQYMRHYFLGYLFGI